MGKKLLRIECCSKKSKKEPVGRHWGNCY